MRTGLACALLVALSSGSASAFKINATGPFAGLLPHVGDPIHEEITAEAMTAVTPSIEARLVLDVQRGVENTDITHQFDGESHFDNGSTAVDDGAGFRRGFFRIGERLASAAANASGNPEFLAPHWTAFGGIADDVAATLRALVSDATCLASATCPTRPAWRTPPSSAGTSA